MASLERARYHVVPWRWAAFRNWRGLKDLIPRTISPSFVNDEEVAAQLLGESIKGPKHHKSVAKSGICRFQDKSHSALAHRLVVQVFLVYSHKLALVFGTKSLCRS